MNSRLLRGAARALLFGTTLLLSASIREGAHAVVDQAIIWLPTGVAIAGLWLLGLRYTWVVALATIIQRTLLHYDAAVILPAAAGSSCEAVLGVWLLRRLDFRATLARLRDVGTLFIVAGVAPLGSIAFSWLARTIAWRPDMPFYSGWDGWWRMNALGVMTVVPVVVVWLGVPWRPYRARDAIHGLVVASVIAGLMQTLLTLAPPGTTGVLLLNLALPLALYAAVAFGPRGAASAGALAAVVVAAGASYGLGPFGAVPRFERHVALQLFELGFVTFPLVCGALIAERQEARASGLASEERRNAIQEALPDIAYRIRADGTILDLYVPTGTSSPYPREVIVGHSVFEYLPPGMSTGLVREARRVIDENITLTLEYPLTLDGRPHIREARCVPYGPGEVLAVVRDITARKRSEDIIAFEAQVLKLVATGRDTTEILSALVEGMERLTRGGRCCVMMLEGDLLRVVTAPSLPDEYNAHVDGIRIGETAGSCGCAAWSGQTVVVQDIDSDPLWAGYKQHALPYGLRACWSVPIKDSLGQVLGTFAVYYDRPCAPERDELALAERAGALAGIALERERSGEALRRSEDLLASLNRNINEGLFRATPDLRLVYANRAFARLFGFDDPEALLQAERALPADNFSASEMRLHIRGLLTERGSLQGEEIRFRRIDGSAFWGLLSTTPVRGADGEILHHDGAIADISARKELEEQFRQSQKMEAVGKLAGGIAHDFNNVLTAIFGYAESIQRETPPGSPAAAHADGVLNAARRAAGLTRQLLAYSRQQVLSPQVLDLGVVVEQLGGMLRRVIGEDIRLVFQQSGPPTRVRVDRGQLEQVVLNLVVNARDAMPDGGTLTLRTGAAQLDAADARAAGELAEGSYVALSVQDTGQGMSAEVRARAFDPFFTTKEQGRGTGLGLSTVYGIARQSGGGVRLESAPGEGTTVTIYLPTVEAVPEEEPAAAPAAAPVLPATILVVEDEPEVRELVQRALAGAGFGVLTAGDGVEALETARAHAGSLDLLVTDMVMPRRGGRELADQLLRERPGLRILYMSGYPSDAEAPRGPAGAETDFIAKPFTARELVERVRRLLSAGAVPA